MARPNILLIVADDLGFSDIGCYGSEIETPNLDRLAAEGLRFSDFHTAPACSPTRSMIMSGTDCHLAGLGVMTEHRRQDPVRWNRPGHEGYLNHDVAALPELLDDAGYYNIMSGKWHLGFKEPFVPSSRGFHRSFAFLPGAGNHFGWEPAWVDAAEERRPPNIVGQSPRLYVKEGANEPNTAQSSEGFYSTRTFADKLIQNLTERTTEERQKPFFAYLPFTAPHWPLQCMPEDRARYKGRYDQGPDVLRQERLARLRSIGLIDPETKPHPVVTNLPEWDAMSAHEKALSARAMEVYAGMIHSIDRESGRVIDTLRESGELDNTLVIFMSDNGAEGASFEAGPTLGKSSKLIQVIAKYYHNDLENLGSHDSYCWIGPRWAQASTAPHRLVKGFTTEGGIRVPFIMRYPGFSAKPGSISCAFTTCMDLLPTFLDLAKATHPNPNPSHPAEKKSYRGREVYGVRGKSWVSNLTQDTLHDSEAIHSKEDRPVGWEMLGRAALRHGQWKIVFLPEVTPTGTGQWQLYDMTSDQGETKDLAETFPDVLKEMITKWEQYQEETGTVFGPPVGSSVLAPHEQIGGDPIEDMRAWMNIGVRETLSA